MRQFDGYDKKKCFFTWIRSGVSNGWTGFSNLIGRESKKSAYGSIKGDETKPVYSDPHMHDSNEGDSQNQSTFPGNMPAAVIDNTKLPDEISFDIEKQHETLLRDLQFLLGFPVDVKRYEDPELLEGLLKSLGRIRKDLQNEGLTLIYEYTEDTSKYFAHQPDPYTKKNEVTEPAILRKGMLISEGIVNVPEEKNEKEQQTLSTK